MSNATHSAYLSFRAGDADREVEQLRASLETRAGPDAARLGLAHASGDPNPTRPAPGLEALRSSAVVLVVVGPRWLEAPASGGGKALDDPADPVRQELLAAIDRRLPMLIVLVRGARMVRAADLPPELTPIAQRPSVEIQAARWEFDVAALVELVKPLLGGRALRTPAAGQPRSAPVPLDVASELRDRASRMAPGAPRSAAAWASAAVWAGVATLLLAVAAAAWWWMDVRNAAGSGDASSRVDGSSAAGSASPLQSALERLAAAQSQAAVSAALASASARAGKATARSPVPANASAAERDRWQADIARLRDEAETAQRLAQEHAVRRAEAQTAVDRLRGSPSAAADRPDTVAPIADAALRPPAPVSLPTVPARVPAAPSASPAAPAPIESPPPAAPGTQSAVAEAPLPAGASPAGPAGASESSTLNLANWAVSTSQGCGAGELRAVGNAQVTITRTPDGVLVSQNFEGTAGPWTLRTSGSASFPAPRPTYELESSGLWTREGSRPFRSISRVTVTARDGGWVPATARGSQYRTECPGG